MLLLGVCSPAATNLQHQSDLAPNRDSQKDYKYFFLCWLAFGAKHHSSCFPAMNTPTPTPPSLSTIWTYNELALVFNGISDFKKTDVGWATYSNEEQINQLKPKAVLLWQGGGKAPSQCSFCHLPMFETWCNTVHMCLFAPCTSYKHCLGTYKECASFLCFI